jgi:hypothetical protein
MLIQKLKLIKHILKYTFGIVILSSKIAKTRMQPVMVDDVLDVFCKAIYKSVSGIIELGGADIYTVEQLIHLAVLNARMIKVPDIIFQVLVRTMVLLNPGLLDKEMLFLLSEDNTTTSDSAQQILGRPLASTRAFFKEQLK